MICVCKEKMFWHEQIAWTKKGFFRVDLKNEHNYTHGKFKHWGYMIAPTQFVDWYNDTL